MTLAQSETRSESTMPFAVFALAAINFAVGTQGFVFAGLLPELARDLGVTVGQAGWLVAGASIAFALGAPIATALVARIERKRVILLALLAMTIFNAASTFAPTFGVLLALRVLGGIATAFVGALATVSAAALVSPQMRGRAFAIVLGGLTLAFVLGVPAGSAVGGTFGWRSTIVFAAIVSLLATALIAVSVPRIEPAVGARPRFADVLSNSDIVRILVLTLLAFTATFTVVAFIGPVITTTTGATGAGVGGFQAFIGLGSIVGLVTGGILTDRGHARLGSLVAFGIMILSLVAYWALLSAPMHSVPPAVLAALILIGASALFSLIPINLELLTTTAGTAAPLALALNGSLVSLGQGVGAIVGGWLTDTLGAAAMGPGGALIALVGLLLAARIPDRLKAGASPGEAK